ncbi:hypothetical protein [Terrabacter sp. 2YAF2]|uniref:hypothetical protein n=1 Tax=Terrabacter sp. 2YAF2 TaxID=3233026 RepID=UPI003F9CC3E2
MAVRWRADPPIEDPIPITKERVVAWAAVIAALTVAVITALWGFEVPLSENLHFLFVAATGVSWLALGCGVYASALARLDVAQIRRAGMSDLLADVVVCALAGIGYAVLAIAGDPWLWFGSLLFMATAVDQARFVRASRRS